MAIVTGSALGASSELEELLSLKEMEVARYVVDGRANSKIAERLFRSVDTVKSHKKSMKNKLGCQTMSDLYQCLKDGLARRNLPTPEHTALFGYWLSRYSFESHVPGSSPPRFRPGAQINLEFVEAGAAPFTHEGKSVCGVRMWGGVAYQHDLHFIVKKRMAIGVWDNSNSENAGCFQLTIDALARAMGGMHLGNTSNLVVKEGGWVWLKVDKGNREVPEHPQLRDFQELDRLVTTVLETGGAVHLDQVLLA